MLLTICFNITITRGEKQRCQSEGDFFPLVFKPREKKQLDELDNFPCKHILWEPHEHFRSL